MKDENTRDLLLQAALKLISEKGYLGATTRDIAREAGVSEVTLFRHFGTKKRLFEELLNKYSFLPKLKELLPEDEDYKFETANSGFEAGILAGSFHPDTIIIDLSLGRSEAIQITANLRKDEAYATTLIVGLASEDEAAPEQLAQYGFNDIFKKPFDLALLGEKIKSIADAKRED